MRFAMFAAGPEDTASSRIRLYTLCRALADLEIPITLGESASADVLFIQKKVTQDILKITQRAKEQGRIIIYDVDDLGEALWYWVPRPFFYKMIKYADVVTTDTIGHRNQLITGCGATCVEIIPDSIDYYPIAPIHLSITESKSLRVLWFGSVSNMSLFEKYIHTLNSLLNVEVVVTSLGTDEYSVKYPSVEFIRWSRGSFTSVLQSCHLTCLMHDGSDVDRAKSNNKMITSISWGVPAVVSRTPEYERTALEAGVEYAIFADELELRTVIERLRSPVARSSYLETAQPAIWSRYAPSVVAQRFLHVAVKYHLRAHSISPAVRPLGKLDYFSLVFSAIKV